MQSKKQATDTNLVRQAGTTDVAVVGMACRFPAAQDYDEYWCNIVSGRNCIREVPANRWDWRHCFGDPRLEPNKSNVKWGGFIDDIDKFDPLFFGISPNEAAFIDPQHRLFLEAAWHAVEDAGYSIASLSGKAIGVYAGVSKNDYSELMRESRYDIAPYVSTGTVHSILVNRVSFLFNLRGKSEAVDTACSSSLVALHNAIRDLASGECEAAIVGGVNALLTPTMFISHSKSGMLSPDGQCKTFSADANGYVRAEGVGVLFIKSLRQALNDRDNVHAVIKSSAINHGGRSNFLTSPTTEAQAAVVMKALGRANIDPRSITYIETHGTGTPLGDPIEINGLKKAFTQLAQEFFTDLNSPEPHCALSSVKTNIGHLESASGMAGLIKVIMAMKHRQIPAIRNFSRLNPYIELDGSPFYIATETVPWERKQQPRRAGVSSFGMGGVNAHVVLEEAPETNVDLASNGKECVIALSAKTGRLESYAESLLDHLTKHRSNSYAGQFSLEDIAYTLQTGRDAFEERAAFLATSTDELIASLEDHIRGNRPPAARNIFVGDPRNNHDNIPELVCAKPFMKAGDLAIRWVQGTNINWNGYYTDRLPRRIPLPTYPFARKRCWFTDVSPRISNDAHPESNPLGSGITLINCADHDSSIRTLRTTDFFIRDHQVQGKLMLPGVVHLELARAAGSVQSSGLQQVRVLKDVYWITPVVMERQDIQLEIKLIPQDGRVNFEIVQNDIVRSKGTLADAPSDEYDSRNIDIKAVRSRCSHTRTKVELYDLFKQHGLAYGSSFQVLESCLYNQREVFAELKLPKELREDLGNYILHPSIMDGMFQAVTALSLLGLQCQEKQYIPFYLEAAEIVNPLGEHCFVLATVNNGASADGSLSFNASLLDPEGNVLVDIKNLNKRQMGDRQETESAPAAPHDIYYRPVWRKKELNHDGHPAMKSLVLFAHNRGVVQSFRKWGGISGTIALVQPGMEYRQIDENVYQINPTESGDYEKLLQELRLQGLPPTQVVYLWGLDANDDDLRSGLHTTIYGVLNFTQAAFKTRLQKNVTLVYIHALEQGFTRPIHAMVAGFARTLKYENPQFDYLSLGVDDPSLQSVARVACAELSAGANASSLREIIYRNGHRHERKIMREAVTNLLETGKLFRTIKPNGVYIISGGAGGLGSIFSHYLAQKYGATTLWLGRSGMTPAITAKIAGIEEAGGKCKYFSVDITDREVLTRVFAQIKTNYREINGVIHAAGVIDDAFILRKRKASFAKVIEPKVLGAINLDLVTQQEKLDFFVVFSSISALMPNQGQSDYSAANNFLDNFVEARNQLTLTNRRPGVSLALNWPLWAEGGMRVTPEEVRHLSRAFGMKPLATPDGLVIFETSLAFAKSQFPDIHQIIAIDGDKGKIERCLGVEASASSIDEKQMGGAPKAQIEAEIKSIFAACLGVTPGAVDSERTIGELGVSSASLVNVIQEINKRFDADLKPTLLFDINTVGKLADYLIEAGKNEVIALEQNGSARWNHSLIDIRQSDASRQIFSRTFKTTEFYLRDHVIDEQYNMPGACYIEMARQAGELLPDNKPVKRLVNNYWASPLSSPGENFTAHVHIISGKDHLAYEIVSFSSGGEKCLHAMGQIAQCGLAPWAQKQIDIPRVTSRCNEVQFPPEIYRQIRAEGLQVGPTFQPMKKIFLSDIEALALLELPDTIKSTAEDYVLHPALLTGAFQAGLISNKRSTNNTRRYIPIGMDEIELIASIPAECYVYCRPRPVNARNEELRKFDLEICRPDGLIVVKLKGFSIRALKETMKTAEPRTNAVETISDFQASNALVNAVRDFIRSKLAGPIGLPIDEIDVSVEFDQYGVNSVMIVELNQTFEDILGPIPKTLFFEHRNIVELADYFIQHHRDAFVRVLGESQKTSPVPVVPVAPSEESVEQIAGVHAYLQSLIAQPIGLTTDEIDPYTGFEQYGVTSVMVVEFNQIFENLFGPLSKTLFFEYRNIDELSHYFLENHRDKILAALPSKRNISKPLSSGAHAADDRDSTIAEEQEISLPSGADPIRQSPDIAIVSAAGRFPGARNLKEFWDVLKKGRDCITEIPPDRFNYRKYFDADPEHNRIYSKWGGFIDDVDKFDPSFFNISPREAELIDPQERLLLELVWEMLEHAGYTRHRLHKLSHRRVGVFVGALWQPYESVGIEATASGNVAGPSSLLYSIANRVSYFLDLTGPSMAIDTACSSSLTALHIACQSIRSGESQIAIVAGVNLSLAVSKYLFLSQNRFLSTDGRCRSYGAGGDGYVPGEGVCALLLKPLANAIADADSILAVIKGSAINHGGRTNGYTVPNPKAQGNVIAQAIEQARIDPRAITYIEGHGTGTPLGDPIEIDGLEKALGLVRNGNRFCAIGSVKSNIGHLEAAAGIVSIIKVILQMQNGQLAPSLHTERLNQNIDFGKSSFRVQRELAPWPRPEIKIDGRTQRASRCAGISSFGAGGSNAHVILEEYTGPRAPVLSSTHDTSRPALFVFSARTEERLIELAGRFKDYLRETKSFNLHDTAYTLQLGREAMRERLAVVAGSGGELGVALADFLEHKQQQSNWCHGRASGRGKPTDESAKFSFATIEAWWKEKNLFPIAEAWVQGIDIDWTRLYGESNYRFLALPTYPFAKERYWLSQSTPEHGSPAPEVHTSDSDDPASATEFYAVEWKAAGDVSEYLPNQIGSATIVVFSVDWRILESFSRVSQAASKPALILVKLGREFRVLNRGLYEIDAENEADYRKLLHELPTDKALGVISVCNGSSTYREQDVIAEKPAKAGDADGTMRHIYNLVRALKQTLIHRMQKILIAHYEGASGPDPWMEAVGGYVRSLRLLGLPLTKINLGPIGGNVTEQVATLLVGEWAKDPEGIFHELRIEGRQRFVKALQRTILETNDDREAFRNRGVYWITGGCGELGFLVAEHLATRYSARLILTGRSQLDQKKREQMAMLQRAGAEAIYLSCDVSSQPEMAEVLAHIKSRYGDLHGVVHAAGLFQGERLIHQKDWAEVQRTLSPKIDGIRVLDNVTAHEALDFFLVFSSLSSILGDFGQCDYAIANRFLDEYLSLRNTWVKAGKRKGKTLGINWPLWREGGMWTDRTSQQSYLKSSGLNYLETHKGLEILERCLQADRHQVVVVTGNPEKIALLLNPAPLDGHSDVWTEPPLVRHLESKSNSAAVDNSVVTRRVEEQVKTIAAEILKLGLGDLHADTELADIGFDSIRLKFLAERLSKQFRADISPSLFFEHTSIEGISTFISQTFPQAVNENDAPAEPPTDLSLARLSEGSAATENQVKPVQRNASPGSAAIHVTHSAEPIAVVGIAGIMPGAPDLTGFWEHLAAGRNMISEVPLERWDWRPYFGDPKSDSTKTNSKWGGFISDVDKFDPLFFSISPKEAEMMDPQHRLFLQVVWHAIEDAGYRASEFSGQSVGIFVGVQFQDYQGLINRYMSDSNGQIATGNSHAMLANRLSYLLNLRGPSEAIDTACSSSLVAIHRAVQSIRCGESICAIAGGVSLALSPDTYVSTAQMGILSPTGKCRTFDKEADGYVKGEGVGALLLKPLTQAQADGDHIYAIIKGTIVGHGGKTSSLTAPSPRSQAELLIRIYKEAGIDPDTIGYIETHGTGTELGDPVEVEGLKQAFLALSPDDESLRRMNYCGLGSVKTNIGHLEPAAGIAGVLKVLLAMKNKKLPASLNVKEVNPYIDLKHSPFFIVRETQEWAPLTDSSGRSLPRRAGVSSFGFGGVNSHIVLEEYGNSDSEAVTAEDPPSSPTLIVLSAKTKDRLQEAIRQLAEVLQKGCAYSLADIAYTLQVGREAMTERLALLVSSKQELVQVLRAHLAGEASDAVFAGRVESDSVALELLGDADAADLMRRTLARWLQNGKLNKLASLWVQGVYIDWHRLPLIPRRRVSLPLYPFAKESYWIPITEAPIRPPEPPANLLSEKKPRCFFEKDWKLSSADDGKVALPAGNLFVLVNGDTVSLGKALQQKTGHSTSIVVKVADRLNQAVEAYEINRQEFRTGQALAETLINRHGHPDYLIDLSDLYRHSISGGLSAMGKIGFYQSLIAERSSQGFKLLHVTQYLQCWRSAESNMVGAVTAGLTRMLSAEYGNISAKTIDIDNDIADLEGVIGILGREINLPLTESEICYRNRERFVPYLRPIELLPAKRGFAFSSERVVVITGGTRGIGMQIANHLVSLGARKVVIMGHDALPDRRDWEAVVASPEQPDGIRRKLEHLLALEQRGVTIQTYSGSLLDEQFLTDFFNRVRREMGDIVGVVHCAGLVRNEHPAFACKTREDIQAVFEPKVDGLMVLDRIFAQDRLDFFVAFSSISAVIPALATGLSDYAIANAFMDYFISHRHLTRPCYQSIQWPSWKETGMGENKSALYLGKGLVSLTNLEGMRMFDEVLGDQHIGAVMPCLIDQRLFSTALLLHARPAAQATVDLASRNVGNEMNANQATVLSLLKRVFANTLKISESELQDNIAFNEYGVDSVFLAELVIKIEKQLSIELDPSVLLEHCTLQRLSRYLEDRYREQLGGWAQQAITNQAVSFDEGTKHTPSAGTPQPSAPLGRSNLPIAVIGVACHFPEAPDKDAYWTNLASGKDCITLVPSTRWKREDYYSPAHERGKSISQWGGFIKDIEYFDPGFFGIDANDALYIDPLERQFLEVSVQTLRDAGYDKQELWGKKVGVFVGTRVANYSQKLKTLSKNSIVGLGQNFIAAHVSHFFNYRGPNLVVDTACSSSLVSVHLACQSLVNRESEVALAGGVDILLDQRPYLILSEARALSSTGKCYTFDERANGFVPGEGCGAVLLKPLSNAIADGDRIYAVIESTAVNNDGNTMGITTPNPEAQQHVIREAFDKAEVSLASCTLIEAHGTGTMIGDPMELTALTGIFKECTRDQQFCSIGSVKTNIGHLLSAAGIASFIKVALSLDHRELPPTLNCERPNPRFDFKNSPFYLNRSLTTWKPRLGVRRAGISSFGFGGTNAHVVLSDRMMTIQQNYRPRRRSLPAVVFNRKRYWLDGENTDHSPLLITPGVAGEELTGSNPQSLEPSQSLQRFFEISEVLPEEQGVTVDGD